MLQEYEMYYKEENVSNNAILFCLIHGTNLLRRQKLYIIDTV